MPSQIEEDAANFGTKLKQLTDGQNEHGRMISIILVVLLAIVVAAIFSLGSMYNDQLAQKEATYADLRDEVVKQTAKIDYLQGQTEALKEELQRAKYINLYQ